MRKTKYNILFLEYFPFLGGGQQITLKIAQYLKSFYNVRFICFNNGLITKELQKRKIVYDIMTAPRQAKLRYLWDSVPFYFKFKNFLQRNNIKLIYCNSYFTAKLATFVSRDLHIPVIWHKHVIIQHRKNSYLASQIRKVSKYVNKIICVSNAVKESLIRIGVSDEKLCVVYNGINLSVKKIIKKDFKKKYKLNDSFVFGSIGFFRREKGFDLLIKAAAIVKKKEKKIKFFIVGKADTDNQYEKELKMLTKESDLENTVIFGGYIDWFSCVGAFDVLIVPSLTEGFCLVIVEAGIYGVPSIAFATGGIPEIIEDGVNGFLVKKITPEALAEKIIDVYNKRKQLRVVGKHMKETVRKKFNEKIMQKNILNIVKEVLYAQK
ncbi:MAG: glycosyltransferase family 4 protein [Candidatus Goldbacteria bacterium]|nr:glycosyltransferase family 4 protein [Candidatus Goldiibacteriota bacterium]